MAVDTAGRPHQRQGAERGQRAWGADSRPTVLLVAEDERYDEREHGGGQGLLCGQNLVGQQSVRGAVGSP
jgi:hypothetical protein